MGEQRSDYYPIEIGPGATCYVDLRTWSDPSLTWYYSLNLPEPDLRTYVVLVHYEKWAHPKHLLITVRCDLFNLSWDADSYWVYAHGYQTAFNPDTMILIDVDFALAHPQVLPSSERKAFLKRFG
jgi:hypothetical protein